MSSIPAASCRNGSCNARVTPWLSRRARCAPGRGPQLHRGRASVRLQRTRGRAGQRPPLAQPSVDPQVLERAVRVGNASIADGRRHAGDVSISRPETWTSWSADEVDAPWAQLRTADVVHRYRPAQTRCHDRAGTRRSRARAGPARRAVSGHRPADRRPSRAAQRDSRRRARVRRCGSCSAPCRCCC